MEFAELNTYCSDATCSRQRASRSSWRPFATHISSRSCQLVDEMVAKTAGVTYSTEAIV